jgi:type III restriction enzyme
MKNRESIYSEYDVDYISGCMSLRKPQKQSLKILDTIMDEVDLSVGLDLSSALDSVHGLFPTCTDFERSLMSLSFALATGVGKTRLMGAFIAYLHTIKGIKNFFVVAPNITIYDKLCRELRDFNNPKYVFKGLSCFATTHPHIVTGDDYQQAGLYYGSVGAGDCTINVFNIAKFNKDLGTIKSPSDYFDEGYFTYLAKQENLVVIMDESHHYRADKGFSAINELKPVLGLELTATPQVEQGTKSVKFKNVVYEYPLSRAIKDGFTKTPYAMTRRDIADLRFSDDDMDKMMLADGILNHERVKAHLNVYAQNNLVASVKPFMLVVCKDTTHAGKIFEYITSVDFERGKYKGKVLVIHSAQKGSEKEENIKQLLDIEQYDNPTEIVIHVNILKEGWDVNNLYTIVPLRAAASKTLREQTVGRGLRLPYGKRTDDAIVDGLIITAHDKFDEIIKQANDPKGLLLAGNVIFAEDIEKSKSVTVPANVRTGLQTRFEEMFVDIDASAEYTAEEKGLLSQVVKSVSDSLSNSYRLYGKGGAARIVGDTDIAAQVLASKDLAEIVRERTDFSDIIRAFTGEEIKKQRELIETRTMAIPMITIRADGKSNHYYEPFNLDISGLIYTPLSNQIQLQNLISQETEIIEGHGLNFQVLNPMTVIATELKTKPEIGDECTDLLFDLITTFLAHLNKKYNSDDVRNIVMFNKKDIANKIFEQMKKHFVTTEPTFIEEICGVTYDPIDPGYVLKDGDESKTLYEPYDRDIKSVLFCGFKKALHPQYKFDSEPEKKFAIACESDLNVLKWLRPAPKQFNLYYDGGHQYWPDFVVETENAMYLVEVKGEDKIDTPEVKAKKERAVRYCAVANVYADAHGLKHWYHLFIPSKSVDTTASIENLDKKFRAN